MGFLVPAFLAGLAALAIPIALHLRRRDTERPQRFPSLMFLDRLPVRTDARRRITDWPLLVLRAAVIALLVAAFARPLLVRRHALAAAPGSRAVVLLLDRSMSMGHGTTWQAALDTARRVIGAAPAGARVAVAAFDDEAEVVQPLTGDRAAALASLVRITPGAGGTRFGAALRAARQIATDGQLDAADAVIITDLQQSGAAGVAGLDLPRGLAVRTAGVAPAVRPNTYVASVDARAVGGETRDHLAVQAQVRSRGGGERRVTAQLHVNGRPSGSRAVTLAADGDATIAFEEVPMPSGLVRGTVSLDPDALVADDTAHFTVGTAEVLKVLLVAPDDAGTDELLYVQRALGIGDMPPIRIDRIGAGELEARTLAGAATVLLWDTPSPGGRAGDALAQWVNRGGGLVIAAGRRMVGRGSTGSLAPARIDGAADRIPDRGGAIGDVRTDHPLFAAFRGTPAALTSARFLRYPRLEPRERADVLARFDDGLPATVEQPVGSGRVVMTAMPLDARAGDFPLQPSYLPFVRTLATYTGRRDATPPSYAVGQAWLLPASVREPVVASPDGSIVRPARDSAGAVTPLRETGIYALHESRVGGVPIAQVAVNPPPAESELAQAAAGDVLLGVTERGALAAGQGELPAAAELERRQSLWRLLLGAVALLLVAEMIVASRGRRGTATLSPEG